jgi:endonuclease/exonuclease/phosphatase family metal-dependent hydrolase
MIKVMSFNIRYGLTADGVNHWHNRKALVAKRIRTFQPDLLGLQECLDNEQADFIRTKLADYQFYGVQREGGGESAIEMAPLLFKKSAFHCLDQGYFWLSETPTIAGSKGWDSDFPRTCTWIKLQHLASNKSLVYLNTHFDYQPIAMLESAKLLHQWIKKTLPKTPLIITGDFNSEKNSKMFQQLTKNRLLFDAHKNVPNTGTFHEFGKLSKPEMLDWLLVSKHFIVINAVIDQYHEGDLYPSDHYPITAILDWKI